ncbi:uroporphyrinogen-III C-methyltransferase [Iamia sp. SCSIO 61187]|uniref:uroporphyrinogen-III C-methyltransferase n=1 Tax=Iamia sp. SCSIO 61187 TaxID=2722752 RepID=UPI001C63AC91|nr:uroporphyrinogen-III C-methyltransferase [Iamia sp. SCSIO 61187]QYG94837.1 uroporphyrinogen-III C-methyltransferase [Iamia sp. SCSIO 61187]
MTVWLVGAGPGDPGLLTLRGAEALGRADVVVHDRLSAAALLDLAPAAAERIDVGKAPGHARLTQEQINALLVERGRAGQEVVRLKGGDPFVFARGSEEAAALAAAGLAYEVVPGITSAIAVPAYAGIPVTQRFSSTAFTVITGHEDPSSGPGTIDWEAAARLGGTLVVLMGVARWPRIAERLLAGGLAPDTPAAAVRWGTRPDQHTTRATLATLGDHPLASPSVIVVGRVAGTELRWFEDRPLLGRRIVVTRTRIQASELSRALGELGAEAVEVPVIAIEPPSDGGAALGAALDGIGGADWLVLTSPNGVERTFAHLPDTRALGGVRVAAIGPGTAAALERYRVVADLVPPRFVAEALLEAFPAPPADGGRVVIARAEEARPVLPDGLRAAGWEVDVVPAYRTVAAPGTDGDREALATADAVTFTSSSTVSRFVEAFGVGAVPPVVACIGPVTAGTARAHGLAVSVEASDHSIPGLVAALRDHLAPPERVES